MILYRFVFINETAIIYTPSFRGKPESSVVPGCRIKSGMTNVETIIERLISWRQTQRTRKRVPGRSDNKGIRLKANRYNVEESMCQTTAYMIEDDREVLLLQDVISIKPENESLRMINLFGEEKIIPGRIKQIDLLAHKILIVN